MKATNFQWVSTEMDKSTTMSNAAQLPIFVCGLDNESSI
jgi:hypothetical protein